MARTSNYNIGTRRNFGVYDALTRHMQARHETNMQKRSLEAAAEERERDRAMQERCQIAAHQAAAEVAKTQQETRKAELKSNEKIAAIQADANIRISESRHRSQVEVAELKYKTERDRGLGVLKLKYETEDRRKKEAEEADRQGGVIRDFNGDRIPGVYNGEYLRSVPQGHGDFYYDDNRRFIGDFVAGRFDGFGEWFDENGILVYKGEWKAGRFNGEGRLRISDNSCFIGIFRAGRFYKGIFAEDFDLEVPHDNNYFHAFHLVDDFAPERGEYDYEGEMEGTRPHGKGRKTYANGDFEEGEFFKGKAHGLIVRQCNGRLYMGEAKDNLPHGHGQLTQPDESVYVGEFVDGFASGENYIRLKDDSEITGQFSQQNDTLIVNGTAKCPDGRILTGEFRDQKLYGEGKCQYPNGYCYKGTFLDNKPYDGVATLNPGDGIKIKIILEKGRVKRNITTYPDGATYTGSWKDGKWSTGTLRLPDGAYYSGSFRNFKRHGHGLMVYPDGKEYDGQWANDKPV